MMNLVAGGAYETYSRAAKRRARKNAPIFVSDPMTDRFAEIVSKLSALDCA